MKISTINVIEYDCDICAIKALHAFTDDSAGLQEAETLFRQLASENTGFDTDSKEIEDAIDDGIIEAEGSNGHWQILLVPNTNETKSTQESPQEQYRER